MRLTRRGWALVVVAPALYGVGRVFGAVELDMLAVAVAVLLVAGAVSVTVARPSLHARRAFQPARLSVGTPGHATIDVTNRSSFRTPTLVVGDAFAGRRAARIVVRPLAGRRRARAAFRVPTSQRGVFAVGPLRVWVTDALGLVVRTVLVRPASQVTVYPRVRDVAPLPLTAGPDLVGGALGRTAQARAGQEFHSLREYVVGDDLRRVHWRSTARTEQNMFREDDVPRQLRTTLLLDAWGGRYRGDRFEVAVEAAASVLARVRRSDALVRFVAAGGPEARFGDGHEHFEGMMEVLATVQPVADDRLSATIARLHGEPGGGALVAFVGAVGDDELGRLAVLRHRFAMVVVLRHPIEKSILRPPRYVGRGAVVVDVPERDAIPAAWESAIATAAGGSGRRARAWRPQLSR